MTEERSRFSTGVYVGHQQLAENISALNVFKNHVYGGLFHLQWGQFGPEYAGGVFHARFSFSKPRKLFVPCKMQPEFEESTVNQVAGEATLFIRAEPALLNRFIAELGTLNSDDSDEKEMETT